MRRLLIGFVGGVAASIIVVWAQVIAWGLHGDFYEDEEGL